MTAPVARRPHRTTLRWRLTLVFGGVTVLVGMVLLCLSYVLVDRAARDATPTFQGSFLIRDSQTNTILFDDDDGQPLTIQDVQNSAREDALRRLSKQGLLALVVLGATGVAATYVLSGRLLRPLNQITAAAQRLSAEQLDQRIDLPGPEDELKHLADTFDAMLARLEASFTAQRRFVADASHELRTPLSVMRTEVDVALADPDASVADLRASAEVVRAATERADRLVDSLLFLARSDRLAVDGLPVRERVELSHVVATGLTAVHAEIEQRRLRVDVHWGAAPVLGDPGLLERLAGNLVENAVRHNLDDGGFLEASTGTSPTGQSWLTVANSGVDIEPTEVEGLFEPFRRHGRARTAKRGAGLGLSIVRAVAHAHGGSVVAAARVGGGLVVRVELPPAPPVTAVARPLHQPV
jgi:signal transduction histidine kinase